MDTADKIIPVGHASQFFDPSLLTGDKVAFQAEADGEIWEGFPSFLNPFDVAREIVNEHSPVVKKAWHRVMIGKSDLLETFFQGYPGVF